MVPGMNPISNFFLAGTVALLGLLSTVNAGDAIAKDDFSSDQLSSKWAAAKGTWKIIDGKLSGSELASDKHAAVATYRSPHTNTKVQFSFQLNGSKGFHLSFNHPKGHLFRVLVSEKEIQIRTDKDKKDPSSKPVMLGKAAVNLEQGKTYTMTYQTAGDSATVAIGDWKVEGKHESLTRPKTGYRLIIKGAGVLFDDFAILSQE